MSFAAMLILVSSLSLGSLTIAIGYRLQQKYPIAFLPAYQGYLASSVVYGLFNWTAIPWIADILQPGSSVTVKVALILGILAIPFLILRVILLCETVLKWTHVRGSSYRLAGYFLFGIAILFPYANSMIRFFSRQDRRLLGGIEWLGTVAIAAQYLAFIYALFAHDMKNDSLSLRGLKIFAKISLFCFSCYVLLAFFAGPERWFRVLLPILYFAVLIPPLLYVRQFLAKNAIRLKDLREANEGLIHLADSYRLSPREQDIVRLILQGKTNKEIADELFVSPHTVKNATSRIYEKTGVRSRSQLAGKFYPR